MKHPNFLTRLCLLALAVTLALPLIPAVAEEDAGNAPENPVVILSANPTTGYTWAVEIADEAVVSVTDDGIAPDSEELTGAGEQYENPNFATETSPEGNLYLFVSSNDESDIDSLFTIYEGYFVELIQYHEDFSEQTEADDDFARSLLYGIEFSASPSQAE